MQRVTIENCILKNLNAIAPLMFQKIEKLYPSVAQLDNENKFVLLLSQENKETNKVLASSIHEWLKTRETIYSLK